MKSSFQLGKIMGIPIRINYSWFIILALIIASLAQYVFPDLYPNWSTPAYWIVAVCTSFLFFTSLLTHELAHSFVAMRRGIPVRSVTLFIFGGVARIEREASNPGTELLMALAGPLASLALAGFFALVWLLVGDRVEPLAAMTLYLWWINLALAAFNMLPGFPLDGGRVLRSIIWWLNGSYLRATRIATLAGQTFGFLLIAAGAVVGVLFDWFGGLWLVFIGGFLRIAASASYRQTLLRANLQGIKAQDLMTGDCRVVPAELTIKALVDEYLPPAGLRCLLVGEGGRVKGIVTLRDVRRVPKRRWSITTVAEAMTPVERLGVISPGADGLTALERMGEGGSGLLLVVSGGGVVGVIERDRLFRFSRVRSKAEA